MCITTERRHTLGKCGNATSEGSFSLGFGSTLSFISLKFPLSLLATTVTAMASATTNSDVDIICWTICSVSFSSNMHDAEEKKRARAHTKNADRSLGKQFLIVIMIKSAARRNHFHSLALLVLILCRRSRSKTILKFSREYLMKEKSSSFRYGALVDV